MFPILVVLAVACLLVAILAAVFLTTLACAGLLVAFILHKLGLDRRLIAYLMKSGRGSGHFKVRVDDLDVPVTAVWMIGHGEGRADRFDRSHDEDSAAEPRDPTFRRLE